MVYINVDSKIYEFLYGFIFLKVCQLKNQDIHSKLEVLKALINAGTDLRIRNDNGKTALKYGKP
jgi:hypothetical protein